MQNKYEILSVIGEGSYGIVYKCRNRETNEIVAIKKFKDNTDISGNKSLMRELKSLKIFNHKNIINFRESFKKKGAYFFVFDYIEKNLLEFLTDCPDGIEPNLIKHIMFQICSGIQQIHKYNLAHRDIKPENILIDRTHKVKICDFGFTRFIEKNSNEYLTEYVATRWYRAPELLIGDKNYGLDIDYWSVGCIMGELIDGNPIFPGENDMEQIYMIYKICGKDSFSYEQIQIIEKKHNIAAAKVEKTKYINPLNNSEISIEIGLDKRYSGKISREALSFLKRLLDPNPKTRIKGEEIFDHPYLLNYYKIYDLNNELYVNNFDNNNNLIKKGQSSSSGSTYIYGKQRIKKEMNATKKIDSNSNTLYPNIHTNTQNNFGNYKVNNNNGTNCNNNPNNKQTNNSKSDVNSKDRLNGNTNINYNNNINNKKFGPIMENFFEHMDSNSYDEGNNDKFYANNKFPNFKQNEKTSQNNGSIGLDQNKFNTNYEILQKEITDVNPNNIENAVIIIPKNKSKGNNSEQSNNEENNAVENTNNFDNNGNDNINNIKFNDYNIEGIKPPNKEERNNYNYYNNIKLYNEDLFEKTGKIKKSINPYESIYKITSQLKKENDKKIKKDRDKDKEKDKASNPGQTHSGNNNVNNKNNGNKNNFASSTLNFNSGLTLHSNREKEKENTTIGLNLIKINPGDLSPISENNILSNNFKKEKFHNSQFHVSMNLDKNKIFISPQKNDTGPLNFNNGNYNNNLNYGYDFNNNIGNFNYNSLINYNLTNNNIAFTNIHNNLNNASIDKNYMSSINFSPDTTQGNKNTKNYNSNLTNNSKFNNNISIINQNINNNYNKTNKLMTNPNNGNDFPVSKSISFNNKNSNININTNRDKTNQINDFFKNIFYANNVNFGLTSVKNSNLDHKRFNSLNSQNTFLVNAEEHKKSSSLKKLQLPIIPKKELGNKV